MPDAKKRQRRWIKVLASVLGVLVLALIAMPLWFPWMLRPMLSRVGVHFERYERLGYGRWAVEEVHFSRKGLDLDFDRVEALLPYGFLWDRWRDPSSEAPTESQITISGWRLQWERESPRPAPRQRKVDSTADLLDGFERYLPLAHDWVRSLDASNGVILLPGQRYELPSARWRDGEVDVVAGTDGWPRDQAVNAQGTFPREAPYELAIEARPAGVRVTSVVDRADAVWRIAGGAAWLGNEIRFTNLFGADTWWPDEAHAIASEWTIPGASLRVDSYEQVEGTLAFDWRDERYALSLTARATPAAEAPTFSPPWEMTLRAEGNLEQAGLTDFQIIAPWAEARLEEEASLGYGTNWLREPARVRVNLDLAELPLWNWEGEVAGVFEITPEEQGLPSVTMRISSSELRILQRSWRDLDIQGQLVWPELEISKVSVAWGESGKMEAEAGIHLTDRILKQGSWSVTGPVPEAVLPEGLEAGDIEASGSAEGSWTNLVHAGQFTVRDVSCPPLKTLDATVQWRGVRQRLTNLLARVMAGEASLEAGGAVVFSGVTGAGPNVVADLEKLDWQRNGSTVYELAQPAAVEMRRDESVNGTNAGWVIEVENWDWRGPGRSVRVNGELQWPWRGRVDFGARGVRLDDARDWVEMPEGEFLVPNAHAAAHWDRGPVQFDAEAEAEFQIRGDHRLQAKANLEGDGTGLRLGKFEIWDGDQRVANAEGRVPARVVPSRYPGMLQPLEGDPLDVSLALGRAEDYWERLTELTGVRVTGPEVSLTLAGTLSQPQGRLSAKARRIEYRPAETNWNVPAAEDFIFELAIQEEALHLEQCEWLVLGQKSELTGQLPLGEDYWNDLREGWQLPDWKQASLDLHVQEAQVAALTQPYTDFISPEGSIRGNLNLRPGGEWRGQLNLTNVSTRPFPPLGPVRDIHASLAVSNRTVRLERLSGKLGGETLNLSGQATLPPEGLPEFKFQLEGTNVPLARRPGLVLRSDLNLGLQPGTNGVPVLSGEINLRDSLFLQNLQELLPGNLARPSQRPPYFSVDAVPVRAWGLDLKVRGERFLQVRSPLFVGEISTTLDLKGTLGQPMALGAVRVNEGRVQFPFGTLHMEQGMVTLTSRNPYVPELLLSASGQNYGYRIRMNVEGTANDPRIQFSSSPPLRSEEIVLMLTAGEIPQDRYEHTGTQKTSRAAMFLGRDLLSRFSRDRATAERLTIRSGEYVTSEGELTYHIEYKLNDRWSLVGEYDRFNALNAGLKWRIYSR